MALRYLQSCSVFGFAAFLSGIRRDSEIAPTDGFAAFKHST